MVKKYFTVDENFETIIKNSLKNVEIISINQVSTGWTNIVFEVYTSSRRLLF